MDKHDCFRYILDMFYLKGSNSTFYQRDEDVRASGVSGQTYNFWRRNVTEDL